MESDSASTQLTKSSSAVDSVWTKAPGSKTSKLNHLWHLLRERIKNKITIRRFNGLKANQKQILFFCLLLTPRQRSQIGVAVLWISSENRYDKNQIRAWIWGPVGYSWWNKPRGKKNSRKCNFRTLITKLVGTFQEKKESTNLLSEPFKSAPYVRTRFC